MKLEFCAHSHIGLKRGNNEDSYAAEAAGGLFAVADGMGGHAAGEIASRMAIDVVREICTVIERAHPLEQLCSALGQAHLAVARAARETARWRGMGTTLSVLRLQQGRGYLAHVGDSRIYLRRQTEMRQLTEDHSLLAEQIRRGLATAGPENSRLGHVLLQAIGLNTELHICRKEFDLEAGDRLLLCSDGLSDMLGDAEIDSILKGTQPVVRVCRELIEQALAAGGHDNITAVVVDVTALDRTDPDNK